jgi:protein-disulfide isomerase
MLKPYLKSLLLIGGLLVSAVSQASNFNDLFRNTSDPVAGNPKGTVTVVEFFDYQCSHCVTMLRVMDSVIKANPNLRVVYKQFPIRGPMSQLAAEAALAANLQGKYNRFSHDLLNASQPLTEKSIFRIAGNAGLDVNELKHQMQGPKIGQQLKQTYTLAQQMRLTGTPAFFIGKTNATKEREVSFILGEMSQNELQAAINKARKEEQ